MTTVASGRCTSAPVPVARAIGTKPRAATKAVIATGRSRVRAPSRTASGIAVPSSTSARMWFSSTKPFRTATPESAMNPTAAETEKGISRSHRAATPPVRAIGTALNTISASRPDPSAPRSRMKISAKQAGTTTVRRWRAAVRFSNCPPHFTS